VYYILKRIRLLITRSPRSVQIGKHTHPLVGVAPTLKHTSVASRISRL